MVGLQEILRKLDSDKRDRIINASLEEFSKHGYRKASTNKIVEKAGISKGLLYHYFGKKENLYEVLCAFVVNRIMEEITHSVDWEEPDVFERLVQIMLVKISLTRYYPKLYDFAAVMYAETGVEGIEKASEEVAPDLMQRVFRENIDFSRFRDDIDTNIAMEIIQWTLEKYGDRFWSQRKSDQTLDLEVVKAEVLVYVDVLKRAFYQPGYEEA
jgi:AcrR family transcriptional regulator